MYVCACFWVGKKRLQYMNVFEDLTTAFGNDERSKSTFRMRTSHPFSSTSQLEYSRTMNVLMAILYHILLKRATVPNISYILRALEILNKLAQSQVRVLRFFSANMTLKMIITNVG